jgi:hypothetical protein
MVSRIARSADLYRAQLVEGPYLDSHLTVLIFLATGDSGVTNSLE